MTEPSPNEYRLLREALINTLAQVAAAQKAGADDWEYQLLTTFQRYCTGLGVDGSLRALILRMQMDVADRIEAARAASTGRPRAPSREVTTLAAACAAVTVMKERGTSLADAERAAEELTALPAKRIRAQRNEFNRGKGGDRLLSYNHWLAEMRSWGDFDRLRVHRHL